MSTEPAPRPERRMLLDTAAMYFRAFYSVPDTVQAPNGMPVNAVRGLLDAIARLVTEFQPTEVVACWDNDWRPQWRVDLIPSYKTHRVAVPVPVGTDIEVVPDPLEQQVPVIREVLAAFGIPIVGADGYEADDVIGTLAATSSIPVDVITSDRDLFQVIDDERQVRVIYTGRGMSRLELLTDVALFAKYGVTAKQYADYAALRGDASDGLPGVPGIGEKSAAGLLAEHGDLDSIIAAASQPRALSATMAAKISLAAKYLEVAPAVVQVVRDLDLPAFDASLAPPSAAALEEIERLKTRWGLGGSTERMLEALRGGASRED